MPSTCTTSDNPRHLSWPGRRDGSSSHTLIGRFRYKEESPSPWDGAGNGKISSGEQEELKWGPWGPRERGRTPQTQLLISIPVPQSS